MPITRSEVGRGPYHALYSFLFVISKVTKPGGRMQFWLTLVLIMDQSLFIAGGEGLRILVESRQNESLPPPPRGSTPSLLQWQFIGSQFFIQPFFVLCWRQLIPQFLLKTIRSSQKDSSTCYPPPPRWIMIGSSTKTQKRKGSVAYIFCLLFQLSWSDEHSSPRRLLPFNYLKVNRVWFFFFFAVKDGEPEIVELSEIAEKISRQWRRLGRNLGVSDVIIDELDTIRLDDTYEKAFQMLRQWKENSSEGKISSYQILFDALTKIGCGNLANNYCLKVSKRWKVTSW